MSVAINAHTLKFSEATYIVAITFHCSAEASCDCNVASFARLFLVVIRGDQSVAATSGLIYRLGPHFSYYSTVSFTGFEQLGQLVDTGCNLDICWTATLDKITIFAL